MNLDFILTITGDKKSKVKHFLTVPPFPTPFIAFCLLKLSPPYTQQSDIKFMTKIFHSDNTQCTEMKKVLVTLFQRIFYLICYSSSNLLYVCLFSIFINLLSNVVKVVWKKRKRRREEVQH